MHSSHTSGRIIAFLLTLTFLCRFAQAEIRTWSDSTGKYSVEAELVRLDDETVVLKNKDGKELRIPQAKLDADGRSYIKRWQAEMKNTASSTSHSIVGLTIKPNWKGKVRPKHFFGFGIQKSPDESVIISSRQATRFLFEPNVIDEPLKKTEVYALDGGKRLQIAEAKFLPNTITEDHQYIRDIFLLPAPKGMITSPLKIASEPITKQDKVLVAVVSLPKQSKSSKKEPRNATIEWKECRIAFFRRTSYFISRIDGGSISKTGVPVLNMNREVVGLVQLTAQNSPNSKVEHGHVVSLLTIGPRIAATTETSSPLIRSQP